MLVYSNILLIKKEWSVFYYYETCDNISKEIKKITFSFFMENIWKCLFVFTIEFAQTLVMNKDRLSRIYYFYYYYLRTFNFTVNWKHNNYNNNRYNLWNHTIFTTQFFSSFLYCFLFIQNLLMWELRALGGGALEF